MKILGGACSCGRHHIVVTGHCLDVVIALARIEDTRIATVQIRRSRYMFRLVTDFTNDNSIYCQAVRCCQIVVEDADLRLGVALGG